MQRIAVYNLYVSRSLTIMAMLCTLSVFLYGIFLLMAVTHTASRTAAERHISKLSVKSGDVEAHYLAEQRSLTPERAQELGFVKPKTVSTVYAADTRVLTLNTLR